MCEGRWKQTFEVANDDLRVVYKFGGMREGGSPVVGPSDCPAEVRSTINDVIIPGVSTLVFELLSSLYFMSWKITKHLSEIR